MLIRFFFGVCSESNLLLNMVSLGNLISTRDGILINLVNLINEGFLKGISSVIWFLLQISYCRTWEMVFTHM